MRTSTLLIGAAATLLAACGGDAGVTGSGGEWVAGRALSIRVTATNMGGTMEVRNDSDHEAPFVPLRIRVGEQVVADFDAGDQDLPTLQPGDNFTFPIMVGGDFDEVRIEMGSGDDHEVFTVKM